MGGSGTAASAIVSLRQNRALLKKRRDRKKPDYIGSGRTRVAFKTVSPKKLAGIKARIRGRARAERLRERALAATALIMLGIAVYGLLFS